MTIFKMNRGRRRLLAQVLVVAMTATLAPMIAAPPAIATINDFKSIRRPFQGVEMGARGRLHDECLYNPAVPCPTRITEYTAQAQVIDKLTVNHGAIHPFAAGVSDPIQWEVYVAGLLRADVIIDDSADPSQPNAQPNPTIIELKRWYGSGKNTIDATEASLVMYVTAARRRNVTLDRNAELAGWQREYLGPDSRRWCVWAPAAPGHVYFAPEVETPAGICNGEDKADENVAEGAADFEQNAAEDSEPSDLDDELLRLPKPGCIRRATASPPVESVHIVPTGRSSGSLVPSGGEMYGVRGISAAESDRLKLAAGMAPYSDEVDTNNGSPWRFLTFAAPTPAQARQVALAIANLKECAGQSPEDDATQEPDTCMRTDRVHLLEVSTVPGRSVFLDDKARLPRKIVTFSVFFDPPGGVGTSVNAFFTIDEGWFGLGGRRVYTGATKTVPRDPGPNHYRLQWTVDLATAPPGPLHIAAHLDTDQIYGSIGEHHHAHADVTAF